MHTFKGKSCNICFNSDMSGEISIINKESNNEMIVDAQDVLDFVANYVRNKRIAILENMDSDDLLIDIATMNGFNGIADYLKYKKN